MIDIDKSKVKKILLIKLRGIGDVVLSTVTFENLIKEFPNAKIDYLTENPSFEFLNNLDFINDVVLFNRKSTWARFKQLFEIRSKKYDLVFDFFSNPATALVTYFSGAKYRCGYPYKGRTYAYNIFGPEERDKYHAAELHLKFLNKIGLQVNSNNLHFGIDQSSLEFAEIYFSNNFSNNDLVIGISPSGGWESKKCDPIKFAEIADECVKRYNSKILILWGPGDKNEAIKIKEMMKSIAIFAPDSTVMQMAALLKKCSFVIANDSGPMHISTAVGTPVLSLHGPTNPKLQGPYGEKHEWLRLDELDCIECNLLECPKHHECFLNLPIERVISKLDILLNKNKITDKVD